MTAKTFKSTTTTAAQAASDEKYVLRLYVAGATSQSRRAILNINAICMEHLQGRCDLEVIDIHQTPASAMGAQIIAAPTLIKCLPLPLQRIIGDLSDRENVLFALDLNRKT